MARQQILRSNLPDMVRAGILFSVPPQASSEEAANAAGLNWQMRDVKLAAMPDGTDDVLTGMEAKDVYGRFKVYPDGRGEFLATVGRKTEQLPNAAVFRPFDELISEGKAEWIGVGSFGNGAKIFGQVQLTGENAVVEIRKDDAIEFKPTAINFNDGGGSAAIGFAVTRIVCQNTFRMAYGESAIIKLRHSKNIQQKWNTAALIFQKIGEQSEMIQKCRDLAGRKNLTAEKLKSYIREVFGMELNEKDEYSKQAEKKADSIIRLFETGTGNGQGSWYDAYNAITEHLTYDAGRDIETRVESQWFGQNALISARAFELAVANLAA